MRKTPSVAARILILGLFLLWVPALVQAQPEQPASSLPPISQQLVREGDFAVQLHSALGLGTVEDEAEAESQLGKVGIIPRNGWIADYPVTPDIFGELQVSVGDAAAGGKIALDKDEALKRLNTVSTELSLAIKPQTAATSSYQEVQDETVAQQYPNPAVINNYYETEGPPIVTYYSPPPDYYYLYGWIPYPFWWAGFWFPGYFILHDFHRSFHGHNRVHFVSNHFNDVRGNRVYRVDPVARFRGRTYAGIGVQNRRGFISTGVPRSQRTIFNAPRAQAAPGMRPLPGMRSGFRSSGDTGRSVAPSGRATGRTFSAPSRGGGGTSSAPSRGGAGRSFSAPSRGGSGGSFSAPSRGGGGFSAPSRGGAGGMSAPSGGRGGGGGGSFRR
jgi:hypothetical protein